jgi:hypothetical protein
MSVMLSELWNACALPWKLAAIEGGMRRSAAVFWIADKASPTVQVDTRLKLSVTDGNCPWWLIASGALEGLTVAN